MAYGGAAAALLGVVMAVWSVRSVSKLPEVTGPCKSRDKSRAFSLLRPSWVPRAVPGPLLPEGLPGSFPSVVSRVLPWSLVALLVASSIGKPLFEPGQLASQVLGLRESTAPFMAGFVGPAPVSFPVVRTVTAGAVVWRSADRRAAPRRAPDGNPDVLLRLLVPFLLLVAFLLVHSQRLPDGL